MKLVLIRHPQPEVAQGVCYGATDLALHEPASATVVDINSRLIKLSNPPQCIISSPLQRCIHLTHELIEIYPNTSITIDNRLQEIDFGRWEMSEWDSLGVAAMNAWIASGYDAHHGGESVKKLDARVGAWFEDVRLDRTLNGLNNGLPIWVITHAGVIRSLLRQCCHYSLDETLRWPIDYGHSIGLSIGIHDHDQLLWSNQ